MPTNTQNIPVGARVRIVKGSFKGTIGTVWYETKAEVGVDFDRPVHGDGNAYVRKASVQVLG